MFSCVVLGVWLHDCPAGCCVCGVLLCVVGVAAVLGDGSCLIGFKVLRFTA